MAVLYALQQIQSLLLIETQVKNIKIKQQSIIALSAVESWWKMVKEALLACSSNGIITLSLDGEMVNGVVSIDNISNIYQKDTAKEITIRVIANEVKVKLPDGEIKDISEMQKVGGKMKHQKEWHTCDRCGAEIEKGILCGNSVTRNGVLNVTYDLCYKCMEDFEEFMRNE